MDTKLMESHQTINSQNQTQIILCHHKWLLPKAKNKQIANSEQFIIKIYLQLILFSKSNLTPS